MMQLCIYGTMTAIFWFGSRFIMNGSMTTGNLMSLVTYTMQMLNSMMMLSMVFTMIVMSRASMERISELLAETPDIRSRRGRRGRGPGTAASNSAMSPSAMPARTATTA